MNPSSDSSSKIEPGFINGVNRWREMQRHDFKGCSVEEQFYKKKFGRYPKCDRNWIKMNLKQINEFETNLKRIKRGIKVHIKIGKSKMVEKKVISKTTM